ncbi:MAG: hypothetical protein M1830_007215 [Pleopsidium flavum]|nr:MAG: hypothetical protein M1830_007215 [Pleopsidium flavum]
MAVSVVLRPPAVSNAPQSLFRPPSTEWLSGIWHVTHSSLPMWKSKRNVRITYTVLPSTTSGTIQGADRLDDIVSYQAMNSDKIKTVHGIDTASGKESGAWDWRGKGLLAVASSHWEVLGYGEVGEVQWVVTYFAKTLFTPAGVDIYSRSENGLSGENMSGIKEALSSLEDPGVRKLAGEIFEIKRDGARSD